MSSYFNILFSILDKVAEDQSISQTARVEIIDIITINLAAEQYSTQINAKQNIEIIHLISRIKELSKNKKIYDEIIQENLELSLPESRSISYKDYYKKYLDFLDGIKEHINKKKVLDELISATKETHEKYQTTQSNLKDYQEIKENNDSDIKVGGFLFSKSNVENTREQEVFESFEEELEAVEEEIKKIEQFTEKIRIKDSETIINIKNKVRSERMSFLKERTAYLIGKLDEQYYDCKAKPSSIASSSSASTLSKNQKQEQKQF